MDIEYRSGREDDAERVTALLEAVSAASPFLGERNLKPPPENFRVLLRPGDTRMATVVAVRGDELVAYAHAIAGVPSTMRHVATVAIAVDRDARGQGVGGRLLRLLIAESRKKGWRRMRASVWANNEPSRRLFSAAGFSHDATVPEQLCDVDGTLVDELIYGLPL